MTTSFTMNAAILITCHNRREKTIACLNALFASNLPDGFSMDIFLVDDGSTDGTEEAVTKRYPNVNIIKGDGNLFWNQGMRLAWSVAAESKDYDYYIWLNDDTILFPFAITELVESLNKVLTDKKRETIITGACQTSANNSQFSYGGRTDAGPVIPIGDIQPCKYINGNIVLVPKAIYKELGNLSADYTHTMGDYDFGLRAIEKGYLCYTTKKFVAVCPNNPSVGKWFDPKISLKKRWNYLNSPKGLNIREYIVFRKKFWGWEWIIYAAKVYLRVLFPAQYNKILK